MNIRYSYLSLVEILFNEKYSTIRNTNAKTFFIFNCNLIKGKIDYYL